MHLQECEGEEKGRNIHAHSPALTGRGVAMAVGVQHAREWSTEIQSKAS
jgi:hypothetical protein